MPLNLSPELLVAKYIKSATNGRSISVRLRRILSLAFIPIWIFAIYKFISHIISTIHIRIRYNDLYETGFLRMNWPIHLGVTLQFFAFIFLPWIILRVIFWIIDADKTKPDMHG